MSISRIRQSRIHQSQPWYNPERLFLDFPRFIFPPERGASGMHRTGNHFSRCFHIQKNDIRDNGWSGLVYLGKHSLINWSFDVWQMSSYTLLLNTTHPTLQLTTVPAYSLTCGRAQALIVIRSRWWYPGRVRPPWRVNDEKITEKGKKWLLSIILHIYTCIRVIL